MLSEDDRTLIKKQAKVAFATLCFCNFLINAATSQLVPFYPKDAEDRMHLTKT